MAKRTYLTSAIDAKNLPQTFEEFDKYVDTYIWRDPQDPSGEVRARTVVSIELTTLFESDTLQDLANSMFAEPVDWSCSNCVDRTEEWHILFEYASRELFDYLLNWSIEPDSYELPDAENSYKLPEADDGTD